MVGMTFAEKVLSRKAGREARAGQIVTVRPDHLLTHDNTSAIVGKIGAELKEFGVYDKNVPVIVLDHVVPASDEKIASQHRQVREFVSRFGLPNFFDVGTGICHQVVVEKGLAPPMGVVVGSDSHTCTYGAVGCFSTGIDRTEAASIILGGELWLKVPESIKVVLTGSFRPGVTAKDLVLTIARDITVSGAAYSCLEFHGDALPRLSIDQRLTVSNMAVEMDAKAGVFPCDELCAQYLTAAGVDVPACRFEYADADAVYKRVLSYDLSAIVPVVAKPHNVDNVVPAEKLQGTKVDQFLLGTCTNGRYSDLRTVADLLRGKRIKKGVRFIVAPASSSELQKALADDTLAVLIAAGAVLLPTGCGPCLGAHQGVLAPTEVCLSTANRNFKGRMGCKDALIYLCSPVTLAASVLEGVIVDPLVYFKFC
jgi:homoaconitate hydratase family protein